RPARQQLHHRFRGCRLAGVGSDRLSVVGIAPERTRHHERPCQDQRWYDPQLGCGIDRDRDGQSRVCVVRICDASLRQSGARHGQCHPAGAAARLRREHLCQHPDGSAAHQPLHAAAGVRLRDHPERHRS
ncbi:hypothetical protein LTR94_034513, partial [Friedmanniomyces endolithicus]